MELTIEERQLVGDFRQLTPEGRHELMKHLVAIKREFHKQEAGEAVEPSDRCNLPSSSDKKAEKLDDPVFTE